MLPQRKVSRDHSSFTTTESGCIVIAGLCQRRGRQPGIGGFTLVELLAVLAIMVLVIAVVLPSFNRSPSTELEAAARSLVAGLRWTRSHAVMGNQVAELTVDLDKRQFLVSSDERVRALPSNAKLILYTARSQVASKVKGSIRFFPDGSSSGGQITVANDRLAYVVDVDWFTGKVQLLETGPDAASKVQR